MGALQAMSTRGKIVLAASGLAILFVAFLLFRLASSPSYTTSQAGYELLDKQKLGASSFQQQIAYQRALEGQIAQTIGQIDGISGAQVQLTLPKDDLFADEKQPATAAVLLTADSATLDPAEVRYASAMQATLGALIARTVGSDKAQVQVHADLDVDKATVEELKYAKKGTPLQSNVETESLKGSGSSSAGRSGTNANLPSYAQNAAAGGNSNYTRKT